MTEDEQELILLAKRWKSAHWMMDRLEEDRKTLPTGSPEHMEYFDLISSWDEQRLKLEKMMLDIL